MITDMFRGTWITDMSADEMEEAKRRIAERDYNVKPRSAPKSRRAASQLSDTELEQIRQQLLAFLRS
jgi:hypothetical protein